MQDGAVRGSALLGQNFTGEKYFHPRPSAAGNGYDAASSGGSNLGPTSQKAERRDQGTHRRLSRREWPERNRARARRCRHRLRQRTRSAHQPANAELQTARVAKARGLTEEKVRELIQRNTDARDLGVLGDPGVNVLELNLALDSPGAQP